MSPVLVCLDQTTATLYIYTVEEFSE